MRGSAKHDLDRQILSALAEEILTTSELARALDANLSTVRAHCHNLESNGLIEGTDGRLYLLFCIDCQEVVTHYRYQNCCDNDHELRSFRSKVYVWELTPKGRSASAQPRQAARTSAVDAMRPRRGKIRRSANS